jgi:MarR family transcriptional regulator for hemolysin
VASPVHDDVRYFGWVTADVSRLMRTVFDRRVRRLGLTRPQWLALTRLDRRPGASQSELADTMEIEKAPAGRLIDRLEEKGWIERRADPADRRINRIYLTDRGQRLHAAILPIAEATVTDALSALSAAERQQVTKLLMRVKATLAHLSEADASIDSIDFSDIDNNDMVEERRL